MASRVDDLISKGDTMFTARSGLVSLWQETAENFYVERADFTKPMQLGKDYAANLTTSYPLVLRRELSNTISAILRPRDRPWFRQTIDREERLDKAGKAWLEEKTGVQRRAMYDRKSQFV